MSAAEELVKVSPLITFADDVTGELEEDTATRKKMLEYYKGEEGAKVVKEANALFNYLNDLAVKKGGWSAAEVAIVCKCEDYEQYRIRQMSRDPENGLKMRFVGGSVDGKPMFTDDEFEAIEVGGTFFHADGVVLRIIGYKHNGVPKRVIRIELPAVHFPADIDQLWVYSNIRGNSSFAFRVDGTQICPLEGSPQCGVSAADCAKFDPTTCDIKLRE